MRINDIILSLAGIEIESDEAAVQAIQTVGDLGPGETVVASIHREGEILTIPIVLGVGESFVYYNYEDQSFLDPSPCGESLLLDGCPPN